MIRQISVFVENQPGSMMNVTNVLTEAHVNIRAISTFDTPEFGIMRLVVDDPVRAKESLTSKGFVNRVSDVIGAELKDEKGNLNQMLKILADGHARSGRRPDRRRLQNHSPPRRPLPEPSAKRRSCGSSRSESVPCQSLHMQFFIIYAHI